MPSITHSDDLIISINLPKVSIKNVVLTVLKDKVDLRCPEL